MSSYSGFTDETPQPQFPQLTATSGFRCDVCGELIGFAGHAWGQWYAESIVDRSGRRRLRNWGFSIVHGMSRNTVCTLERPQLPSIGDCSLDFLLSADGFTYMQEFFVEREVDNEELSCFMMRLFVPGYEQVFRLIPQAISAGVHEPRCNSNFLTQAEIANIAEAHEEGRC